MEEKVVVTGSITRYIYSSSDSLFKVCAITQEDGKELIITGSFPMLEDGLNYEFVGKMKNHPKYGTQLAVESYAKSKSFTRDGLIHYLSSDKFYGIGPKLATNIVDELGLDCINIILENPEELNKVNGLTKAKSQVLVEVLKQNYANEQVYIRLYGFGLTAKMIEKLIASYGTAAQNVIEEDPYRLIYDVDGFGFKKCDALALNLGFKLNDERRIKAALIYTLNTVCYQQGFVFLTSEQLINSAASLLGNDSNISQNEFQSAVDYLIENKKIVYEDDRLFDSYLYSCERICASRLVNINDTKIDYFDKNKVADALDYVEKLLNIKYTPLQKEAIINAITNKISIITGGPGTGKSTILNGILRVYALLNKLDIFSDEMDYKCLLVAPTGRAAKRMSEATNMKATTIHKALGYGYDGEFSYNDDNQLAKSLLIVDEVSMLDISIAASLFKAIPNKCQIILVGDANQLPSVGPGNVLEDLLSTNRFKITKLNQIMRQSEGSDIVALSHMMLQEKINYSIFSRKKEVYFYDYEAKNVINGIFKMLDSFIKSGGDIFNDIQILIPMYAGVAGIDAVNSAIQAKYNPETEKIIKRDLKLFKKNDKVLQLKNDSELDVMNGDIGKIIDIVVKDDKDAMLIDFDGRVVTYYASNIDNLTLAYAISIHKSQGSEFDNVIMPILPSYQIMLKKKVIYTGITRAKKKLIILGKLDSVEHAIHVMEYKRQTTLSQRIGNSETIIKTNRIIDPNIPFDTLGEYDMDGITPYNFM